MQDGRAVAVRTADGERYAAGRAVVADVLAPALYERLLAPEDVPDRMRAALRPFALDPGTVKVDWALDGPIPWTGAPDRAPGTVHIADSVEEMNVAMSQVQAGAVPATALSAHRADDHGRPDPVARRHRVVLGLHPRAPADALRRRGRLDTRIWDHDDLERFADRMQGRIEQLAPGFRDRVRARRVLGPRELEERDANLVGGALNGGTAQLHQQLVFRPVPGLGRAETPIRGLYLGSASAHPGGGVHGACGSNAARAALAHERLRPWRR